MSSLLTHLALLGDKGRPPQPLRFLADDEPVQEGMFRYDPVNFLGSLERLGADLVEFDKLVLKLFRLGASVSGPFIYDVSEFPGDYCRIAREVMAAYTNGQLDTALNGEGNRPLIERAYRALFNGEVCLTK